MARPCDDGYGRLAAAVRPSGSPEADATGRAGWKWEGESDAGPGPQVPFGAGGLTLYAADLEHLSRVRAGRSATRRAN